jgi:hypothetical protein
MESGKERESREFFRKLTLFDGLAYYNSTWAANFKRP